MQIRSPQILGQMPCIYTKVIQNSISSLLLVDDRGVLRFLCTSRFDTHFK
jgi:hypothetical protein